jgi:hypothetical protein
MPRVNTVRWISIYDLGRSFQSNQLWPNPARRCLVCCVLGAPPAASHRDVVCRLASTAPLSEPGAPPQLKARLRMHLPCHAPDHQRGTETTSSGPRLSPPRLLRSRRLASTTPPPCPPLLLHSKKLLAHRSSQLISKLRRRSSSVWLLLTNRRFSSPAAQLLLQFYVKLMSPPVQSTDLG